MSKMLCQKIKQAIIIVLLVPWSNAGVADSSNSDAVKQTMGQAFKAITHLIDVALDQDPELVKDDRFYRNLDLLQSLSSEIAEHTKGMPSALNLATISLEESIDQLVANYKSGYDRAGEAYLIETIDHCVACHTHSPDLESEINVDDLIRLFYSEEVNTSVAARVLIAARRIPEAIQIWEVELLSKDFSLDQVDSEEVVLEYISQVIHLEQGTENMGTILTHLSEQGSTPYYFKRKIDAWIKQAALASKHMDESLTLDSINSIKNQCIALEAVAVREEYFVCSVLVSSMSSRMLKSLPVRDRETEAQLYINMGKARFNSGLPVGYVPQIERFLEAAIIAAPDTEIAKEAYANLEELAYFLYNDLYIAEEIMNVSFDGLKQLSGIQ